jgi:hypothetical protein
MVQTLRLSQVPSVSPFRPVSRTTSLGKTNLTILLRPKSYPRIHSSGEWLLRKLCLCLLFLICVLSFSSAPAQETKPLVSLPPEGFEFTGSWDCEGAFRNAQVHKSTFTGAVILGGKWLELTEQDIQPATGYLAKYLIGYDPQQKRIVEFDVNNFGAAIYTSPDGWQNHVLTMTSAVSQDPKAPYAANRFLYTIAGKNDFSVDWQISKTADPNWIPSDHLACKRRVNG